MDFLWGILGIVSVLAIAYFFSLDRKQIYLRTILGALAIQIIFAFLTLKSTAGRAVLEWISSIFTRVVDYANEGISFMFGPLVGDGAVFAFEILTIIIFFSSLISILYYLGVMQWFINIIGGFLSKLLKTTKIESLAASANIFVSHTEAPLVVKPFIKKMHQSELFAMMVGGFGSVSGSVLVGYSLMGIPLEYLLAATFMSAPAGLLIAKIIIPLPKEAREQLIEEGKGTKIESAEEDKPANVIDAAATGASTGLKMAIEVAGTLLAFVAIIALINGILGSVGGMFGFDLTLEGIFGVILAPIAFLIGVPWEEAFIAGQFIGQKIAINEFVAFANLGEVIDTLSDKATIILSFALAGFANLGSIAIQIGSISTLAPNRRAEVSKLGFRAMLGGCLVSLLNAAIAGMFI
ncbi:CNT family concentrative nucleoside transporter [Gracilibacillus halotolerans]|uniref:Nucleoside permease n=1 Tax=Gracilibacillus halotolerans TaxID=74386 RepID=A0A841RIP7_9BACI|nr:NupC/NupG family nucleoside CNT transporter [Gracilibacillus halotolerans]MBB6512359.1 CNT family concentrative nucleoside transporter [Gracilibacillus halotolerans]